MFYRKVDLDGNYIEEVAEVEETEEFQFIAEPVPVGLYLPKWNGSKWIEGRSQEWIDDYLSNSSELSPEQQELKVMKRRLDETENALIEAIDMILMGGM